MLTSLPGSNMHLIEVECVLPDEKESLKRGAGRGLAEERRSGTEVTPHGDCIMLHSAVLPRFGHALRGSPGEVFASEGENAILQCFYASHPFGDEVMHSSAKQSNLGVVGVLKGLGDSEAVNLYL